MHVHTSDGVVISLCWSHDTKVHTQHMQSCITVITDNCFHIRVSYNIARKHYSLTVQTLSTSRRRWYHREIIHSASQYTMNSHCTLTLSVWISTSFPPLLLNKHRFHHMYAWVRNFFLIWRINTLYVLNAHINSLWYIHVNIKWLLSIKCNTLVQHRVYASGY